jgi:SAM-dependent methyltransferase
MKRILNIGSGPESNSSLHWQFRGPDWEVVRLDADERCAPDILASVVYMPNVPDAGFDAVWSSHLLEHLFDHEVPKALKEILRVLVSGGVYCMRCPNLRRACEVVSEGREEQALYTSQAGPIRALDMIFGHRLYVEIGCEKMAHHTGFTKLLLEKALQATGFADHRVWEDDWDLWAEARKA